MNLSQSPNVMKTHVPPVYSQLRQLHRTRCDGCRSFQRRFSFHSVMLLFWHRAKKPRRFCGQNTKRYSHRLLLALITHSAPMLQPTDTADNLNFSHFVVQIYISVALVRWRRIAQLSDLHEAYDPSIRRISGEQQIRGYVGLSIPSKETDVRFHEFRLICRNTCNVGGCQALTYAAQFFFAHRRTIF